MRKKSNEASEPASTIKEIEVTVPNSTQNLEFLVDQIERRINGYDCSSLVLQLNDSEPRFIVAFDFATRLSVCYFKSKEIEALLKSGAILWALFDSINGSPKNKNIKVTFKVVICGLDEGSATTEKNKKRNHKSQTPSKKEDVIGQHDLMTTSALVYLQYILPDGENKRLAIMNGNIRSNVVGSDFIEGYHDFDLSIKEGDLVRIIPEPNNPYDKDAMAVYWRNKHIGYIPKINIPGVALCMDPTGIDAVVYENNLGWIAIYIEPTLKNLGDPYYDNHFGPYSFEVVIDEKSYSLSVQEFKDHFYYKDK